MRNRKEKWLAFLLVSPSILAVAIFVYGFIGWTIRVSFSAWKGMIPDYTFVGLKNYIDLFTNNQRFQIDIRNTLMFTTIFVLGTLILGLLTALLLDQGLKGEGFFRSLYHFPDGNLLHRHRCSLALVDEPCARFTYQRFESVISYITS